MSQFFFQCILRVQCYLSQCLSGLPENEPAQAPILRLLQDVCSESGELPSNYWLKRVTVNWRQCIGKGGEALIFVGCLHDRKVVARQIHKPDNKGWDTEAGQAALKVCLICFVHRLSILLNLPQYIRREIITHAQLRHPNVIAFLGVFRDDDNGGSPMVILPFMENGSAMDYLKQLSATELRISISSIVGWFNSMYGATLTLDCGTRTAVGHNKCPCVFARQKSSHLSWRCSSGTKLSRHLEDRKTTHDS